MTPSHSTQAKTEVVEVKVKVDQAELIQALEARRVHGTRN